MLRRLVAFIQILLGLAVLLALAGGIAWIIYTSVTRAPAVVAAVVTGFAAILGLGIQRYMEQTREDDRIRRERMAPIYEDLVTTFYKGAGGGLRAQEELESFFERLAQSLLIWGSEPVLVAFNRWRSGIDNTAEVDFESMLAFEQLLYAIRGDLGNRSSALGPGDLLRVFINDIDDYLPLVQEAEGAG